MTGLLVGCWLILFEPDVQQFGYEQQSRALNPGTQRVDIHQPGTELPESVGVVESLPPDATAPRATSVATSLLEVRVVAAEPDGAALEGIAVYVGVEEAAWYAIQKTTADGVASFECPGSQCVLIANRRDPVEGYGRVIAEGVKFSKGVTRVELALPLATSRLSVRVVDDRQLPVPGVVLSGHGPPGRAHEGHRETGHDGVATWDGVVAGAWWVSVVELPEGFSNVERSRLNIELPADESILETMRIERLGVLRVDVAQARLAGGLALLQVWPGKGPDARRRTGPRISDVESWRLPIGAYEVVAEWAFDSDYYSPSLSVDIAAGQTSDVALPALIARDTCGGWIIDARGEPVEGIHVSLSSARADLPGLGSPDARSRSWKRQTTGPDGRWTMRGIPRGQASLNFYVRNAKSRHWASVRLLELEIPTSEITVVLQPGYRLRCSIQGASRQVLIDGRAKLRVLDKFSAREYIDRLRSSNIEDGAVEFEHVAAGTYVAMLVRHDGTLSKELEIDVPAWKEEGAWVEVELDFDEEQQH